TLGQLVAIKFIHPRLTNSVEALRRFDTEAKAAARLKTRHAVAVYDHGVTADSEPYIVMEYLEGESLEHMIRRRGRLPFPEVTAIIAQAARALTAAHEQGIVHRDLKPDNIFLAHERDAGQLGYVVKLVDFGIAKIVEEDAARGAGTTQAGMVLGTPHYMSPEALTASAPVGPAADVWSLGACAFAAACGRVPFEGDAIGDVVLKVCAAPLPVPSKVAPELPHAFDEWFKRACARRLEDRFASIAEAAQALAALESWNQARRESVAFELAPNRASQAVITIDEPRASRRGLVLGGVLVGASGMLAVLGYYVMQRTRAADEAAAAVAASARALIDRENERKLRESEAAFWARQSDAGEGARDGGTPAPRKKKRPR
ncbi:MAG TPA: serine/threonine-protein kinase, partial [Polyangiaceae bacterium]|nr:serine/threonine-protein kinase [Polyangiaceae bacterium]